MDYQAILITGGAGFIGSNLAVYLRRKYPRTPVFALDNLKRRGSEITMPRLKQEGVRFIHGDIRCREDLCLPRKIDLLIECSAEPSVMAGFGDNPSYIIQTNLAGALNCFELAREHKADIVFLSTSRVYPYEKINSIKTSEKETRFVWKRSELRGFSKEGISRDFPIDGAKTLYGATKLAAEHIMTEYLSLYGLKGVINRCGVIAGPWQFGKTDQGFFTHWMLAHYFKKRLDYIGFGGKGKQVRDLLHIDDLCELIDTQLRNLSSISGRVFNVGGGTHSNVSLREATALCRWITGNRISVGIKKQTRPGDIVIYISDNTRVSRDCGWRPKKTPEQIGKDIFGWIRANEDKIDW